MSRRILNLQNQTPTDVVETLRTGKDISIEDEYSKEKLADWLEELDRLQEAEYEIRLILDGLKQ